MAFLLPFPMRYGLEFIYMEELLVVVQDPPIGLIVTPIGVIVS